MVKSQLKSKKNFITKIERAKTINYVPLLILVGVLSSLIANGQLLIHGSLLVKEKDKPIPRYVELVDGKTIKATEIPDSDRSERVIQEFVTTMMEILYSASNTITDDQTQEIYSNEVEINGKKTTALSAIAMFFIEPEVVPIALEDVSKINSEAIFSGEETRALKIRYLSQPQPVEGKTGQWELKMIANLYSFEKKEQKLFVSKFNKKIVVEAVNPISNSSLEDIVEKQIPDGENKEYLKELFTRLGNAGLEIKLTSTF